MSRVAAAALALAVVLGGAPARAQEPEVRKVLIVSMPRLTWEALEGHRAYPALATLLRVGAVASMSPRTVGPTTSLGEAYATIGAGNRATVATAGFTRTHPWLPDGEAGLAFHVEERFGDERAGDVFSRRAGPPPESPVVHLGMHSLDAANDALLYDAEVGALGSALRQAGRRAAVIANADERTPLEVVGFHREAALAVVDERGEVGGDVRAGVDPAVAFERVWPDHDVVLVENSALERADASRAVSAPGLADIAVRTALRDFDDVLARLLRHVDLTRDLVVVVAPAPPRAKTELTVFAMAGAGVEPGRARSATTRRTGYVTLPDVAPTVLQRLGVAVPDSMTGTAITSDGGGRFSEGRLADLAAANERALFRDRMHGPLSTVFVVFQVLVYALAVLALRRRRSRWLEVAAFGALIVLAVPPLVFLSGLVRYRELGAAGYGLALFAGAAVLAGAAWRLGRRHALAPPLALVALLLVVLVADIVTGGRLQLDTVFGYSPIVAGRFAGFGNLAFALLAISALITVTAGWAMSRGRRGALVAGAVVLTVVAAVDGHPSMGSDVGGVLSTVPAFAVTLLLLAGARIGYRRGAVIAAGTALVLAVFAFVDLARPESSRTHLGRLVSDVADGGVSGFFTVLERKASANLSILTTTVWAYVIPVAFAFLTFLVWRPHGRLLRVIERVDGLHACLVGAVVAGLIGFSLNDSGVVVPATMLAVLLPYLTWLVARVAPVEGTPSGTPRGAGTRS
ncbi:MAG TPA: hypothetical protein VHF47_05480 [Acidimicrobiales bacterium]|nr:hypothetical protein [Acidimicrobiales bacterium]